MSSDALVARSGASEAVGDALVDYLQRTGKHYDEHIELLRRQKDLNEEKELTFRPALTQRAYALEKTSVARRSEPIEARLHHLHAKKLEREEARQAARERAQEAEIATYPFRPQLTAHAETLERPGVVEANRNWEAQRDARHRARQDRAATEALREVTGVPVITAYAHEKAARERPAGVPVEDLLLWQENQRQRQLYAATQAQLSRRSASVNTSTAASGKDGLTAPTRPFEPSISQYAARLTSSTRTGETTSIVERLSRPRETSQPMFDEADALHCTFHPSISPASQEMSQLYYDDVTMHGVGDDVHERLYAHITKPSKYRKDTVEEPTWRPAISAGTQRILARTKRRDGEHSPSSRLHSTRPRRVAARTHAKPVVTPRDLEESTAYTYRPTLNPKSEELWNRQVQLLCADGHARSPKEARALLWRRAQKRSEDAVQRQRQLRASETTQECTFAPKAGRPPRRVIGGPGLSLAERAALWAQQREQKLLEARAEQDEQEVAKYSFRPHVDPVFPLPSERSRRREAPGVSAYVARQEEARRRKEEATKWWAPRTHREAPASSRASSHTSDEARQRPPPRAAAPYASRASAPVVPTTPNLSRLYCGDDSDEDGAAYEAYEEEEEVGSVLEVGSSEESFLVHRQSEPPSAHPTYADLPYRPVPSPSEAVRSSVMMEGSPVAAMLTRQRAALGEY